VREKLQRDDTPCRVHEFRTNNKEARVSYVPLFTEEGVKERISVFEV